MEFQNLQKIVFGIDPGVRHVGVCVALFKEGRLTIIDLSCTDLGNQPAYSVADSVYRFFTSFLVRFPKPAAVAVEEQHPKNVKAVIFFTTIQVICLSLGLKFIPVNSRSLFRLTEEKCYAKRKRISVESVKSLLSSGFLEINDSARIFLDGAGRKHDACESVLIVEAGMRLI